MGELKKITKSFNIEDFEVLTDNGFVDCVKLHETIPYEVYELKTLSGKILKCADNHIIFKTDMSECFVSNLNVGDYIITDNKQDEVISVTNLGYNEVMYDLELVEGSNRRYYTNGILSHNTQLVKGLTEYLFEGRDNLIRVDMNEYSEKFNQSRLIGSPPGYVGYDEGGELTEKVRRKPYSVVLFDEVEKAHPDIFNLLLRTFDEGFMTDASGRKVDFRNTIMIMTSNLGTKEVRDQGMGIGFTNEKSVSKEKIDSTLMKELKKFFKPEFLNRLDDVIVFNPLEKEHIFQIFDVEIVGLKNRISGLGYTLDISEKMKEYVVNEGYDAENGARPLKRSIEKCIEDPISEELLKGDIKDGETLFVDYDDEKIVVSIKKKEQEEIAK
jgi:hypothetical protein